MMATLHAHGPTCVVARLSAALGVPQSSAYRWRRPPASSPANDRNNTIEEPTERIPADTAERTTAVVARTPSPRAARASPAPCPAS